MHTLETQLMATKFCAPACPMQEAYTESEVTRLATYIAIGELYAVMEHLAMPS